MSKTTIKCGQDPKHSKMTVEPVGNIIGPMTCDIWSESRMGRVLVCLDLAGLDELIKATQEARETML